MKDAIVRLTAAFERALVAAFGDELAGTDPLLTATNNPKFGDYQSNAALALAKHLGKPPREIATAIATAMAPEIEEFCAPPTLAGPGFINFVLKGEYLVANLRAMQGSDRLAVPTVARPQRTIVDFSSPNIAKEMHVGHLRSTIIGDAIARTLEFLGHDVLRLNHVGDWGTQFGMLIAHLQDTCPEALTDADALDIGDLVTFYQAAKRRFDEDEAFKVRSRDGVVGLQGGDAASRRAWELLCEQSRREFQKIYDRLDIEITERGESFYNPLLPETVAAIDASGLLVEDGGAKCVFLEGFTNKDGNPLPAIVQKSDGGYNYVTTDLAAICYRIAEDCADRIIYVTDSGQANHFAQVFQVARRVGFVPDSVELVHVPFGLVQGEDGKKLKTRSGDTPKLRDLLDEAVSRSRADLEKRLGEDDRCETEAFIETVATTVGIAAVKYADLSQNRTSSYAFSYDKMLALQGNTAPYLLYAYARIQSISRKGEIDFSSMADDRALQLVDATELALAKHLLKLDEVLDAIAVELMPNRLCEYLFDLSKKFNQFYDRCPVLQAEEPARSSRLLLCNLTARTLKLGFSLLGIPVLDRM